MCRALLGADAASLAVLEVDRGRGALHDARVGAVDPADLTGRLARLRRQAHGRLDHRALAAPVAGPAGLADHRLRLGAGLAALLRAHEDSLLARAAVRPACSRRR